MNLRVIEPNASSLSVVSPYQEIATYVRELLKCDYAFIAVPEKESIRILAMAGAQRGAYGNLETDLVSKLRDWGPVVVDDSRLIAVPVQSGDRVLGVIVGYSSKPGAFTMNDLENLTAYSHVAGGILAAGAAETAGETKTQLSPDELLHFSRLITIGELSACFAHEVTNPLMLIRGHLRFVEESLTPGDPLRTNFEVIDRASRRIEEMAQRMLDFSKKKTRRTEACDIAELISDALRFVQPYIRSRFIDVQVNLDPQLPLVGIDRGQMVQAVVNLLQNAVDAMADLDRRILSITARIDGPHLRIAISDIGKGIASANISKIFDPFFTTKGERGTGLGLYITRQVIEEHRGEVNVQTSDRGSTFVISLPL
jgi:signal transduction histidine kinase